MANMLVPSNLGSSPIQQLKRTLMSCMLWEDHFYECGVSVDERVKTLVPQCEPEEVAALAIQARTVHNLRYVPLLLMREIARMPNTGRLTSDTLEAISQYPNDISRFLSMYWNDETNGKRKPLTKPVRIGLGKAFNKFDESQLLALQDEGVPSELIHASLESRARVRALPRTLPFHYVAAYRKAHEESVRASINTTMLAAISALPVLHGRTLVLVDVSKSMEKGFDTRLDLTRMDVAAALAVYLQGVGELTAIATFSGDVRGVPGGEPGIPLIERIVNNQPHKDTRLAYAISKANEERYDRIVVITDDHPFDRVSPPLEGASGYVINIAPDHKGVDYSKGWNRIDGFSEQVINYIQALEADGTQA